MAYDLSEESLAQIRKASLSSSTITPPRAITALVDEVQRLRAENERLRRVLGDYLTAQFDEVFASAVLANIVTGD